MAVSASEPGGASRAVLRQFAEKLRRLRFARLGFVAPSVLSEAWWDMLLALYSEEGSLRVDDLSVRINKSKNTLTRWIAYLEQEGLVEHTADEVSLTACGLAKMDALFAEFVTVG